jgi:hypothetical protein
MLRTAITVVFVAAALPMGCDQGMTPGEGLPEIEVSPHPSMALSNASMSVGMNEHSTVSKDGWAIETSSGNALSLSSINFAGILLATPGPGARATSGASIFPGLDALEFAESEEGASGIYLIDRSQDGFNISNWPKDLHPPLRSDGSHKRYGDTMAWSAFVSSGSGSGVDDVLVGVSLFLYDSPELKGVTFLRYDITNIGETRIPELLAGFFSDTDLIAFDQADSFCDLKVSRNQSGYDVSRSMAYAYVRPQPVDGDLAPECYGIASGIAMLEISGSGIPEGVYSSRIVTKSASADYYPAFSSAHFLDPPAITNALRGLDVQGRSMVDPLTSLETNYAFTGDPVQGTGWHDARNDIRQLLSKPSFSLNPGETKSFALAVILATGEDFGSAISSLQGKQGWLSMRQNLWDF